jgi:hypothetical protein
MNAIKICLSHSSKRLTLIWLIFTAGILVASTFIVVACNRQRTTDKQDPAREVKVTVEEAMEIVRQFAVEPLPDLTLRETIDNPVARLYILKDGNVRYWVNVNNGAIVGVQYADKVPISPDVNISIEEAEAAAIYFAQKMYLGFSNLILTERQLIDHRASKEYLFVWTQTVDLALTPNTVNVSVNPVTGEVCTYMSSAREIQPFTPSKVSASEAKTIAKNTLQTERNISVSEPLLTITFSSSGEQLLVWQVQVDEVVGPEDYQHGAQYSINAYTGEIVQAGVY